MDEKVPQEIQLVLYPNPTVVYPNFYLRTPNPVKEVTFCIINTEGMYVKEFKSSTFNATFIFPVWDLASGVYWLQVVEDGKVLKSEQFIISK